MLFWLDKRLVDSLLTLLLFWISWAFGVILSFHTISAGLWPAVKTGSALEIWTNQNMINGLVVVGLMGLVYSLLIDGVGILLMLNINPCSFHGISTMCVLVGLARIVAAIHSAVSCVSLSSYAPAVHYNLMQNVLDIREVEGSERISSAAQRDP